MSITVDYATLCLGSIIENIVCIKIISMQRNRSQRPLARRIPTLWLLALPILLLGNFARADEATSFADKSYQKMSATLQSTADWLDTVFFDERYVDEYAWSRLVIRADHEIIEGEGVVSDLTLRGKIVLPNLNRKIRLIFEGDQDYRDEIGAPSSKDSSSAIRLLLNENVRERLNFDIGARGGFSDPRIFTRLQYRYQQDFGATNLRFRPTLIWNTDDEWEGSLQFDYERQFSNNYFFRMTSIPRFNSGEAGWEFEQNFKLFKELYNDQYLALEWKNDFKSEPDLEVRGSYLRFRYRREVWKERVYFEFGPGIRVVDHNDLRPQVDAYLRFELLLNSEKSNNHNKARQKYDPASTTRGDL